MSDPYHDVLLHLQRTGLRDRTPFCPDDQQLAEYFDGGLDKAVKVGLERHFAECRYCRARIGVIQRVFSEETEHRIPGDVLAAAKRMPVPGRRRRIWSAPAWAAAAVLVMTVAMFMNYRPGTPDAISESGSVGAETRQVRSVGTDAGGIKVLRPVPGDGVRPGAMLEWVSVPDSLHYDVFVLTGEGDVVVVERVRRADWVLDGAHFDAAGGNYYFRVVAFLPDGRKLHSRHVPFELQPE